jgi:hypothetical protein
VTRPGSVVTDARAVVAEVLAIRDIVVSAAVPFAIWLNKRLEGRAR